MSRTVSSNNNRKQADNRDVDHDNDDQRKIGPFDYEEQRGIDANHDDSRSLGHKCNKHHADDFDDLDHGWKHNNHNHMDLDCHDSSL